MTRSWSKASKAFHWVGAALIFYLLIHGFWMVGRWTHAVPPQPAGAARWEVVTAHAGHWGLYALMLAAALSGWALAGTFKRPLDSVFG